jgi:hypothetical protein
LRDALRVATWVVAITVATDWGTPELQEAKRKIIAATIDTWEQLMELPGFAAPVVDEEMRRGIATKRYAIKDRTKRPCGKSDCQQRHFNGWVILLPHGGCSHVGKDCAAKVFGVDFDLQIKAAESEQKARSVAEILARLAQMADTYERELAVLEDAGLRGLRSLLSSFVDLHPSLVRDVLDRAHKDRPVVRRLERVSGRDVDIASVQRNVLSTDADEIGEAIATKDVLAEVEVGRLQGLAVFTLRPCDVADHRMRSVIAQFRDARNPSKEWVRDLMKMADALPGDLGKVKRGLAEGRLFFAQPNLDLLRKLPAVQGLSLQRVEIESSSGLPRVKLHHRTGWNDRVR